MYKKRATDQGGGPRRKKPRFVDVEAEDSGEQSVDNDDADEFSEDEQRKQDAFIDDGEEAFTDDGEGPSHHALLYKQQEGITESKEGEEYTEEDNSNQTEIYSNDFIDEFEEELVENKLDKDIKLNFIENASSKEAIGRAGLEEEKESKRNVESFIVGGSDEEEMENNPIKGDNQNKENNVSEDEEEEVYTGEEKPAEDNDERYFDRRDIENNGFSEVARRMLEQPVQPVGANTDTSDTTFESHFLTPDVKLNILAKLPDDRLVKILDDLYTRLRGIIADNETTDNFLRYFKIRQEDVQYLTPEYIHNTLMGKYYHGITHLLRLFVTRRLTGNDTEETIQNSKKFDLIFKILKTGSTVLMTNIRLAYLRNPDNETAEFRLFDTGLPDIEKQSPFQRLLLYLLSRLSDFEYRRYRGQCFKQIKITHCQDVDGNKFYANLESEVDAIRKYKILAVYETRSWSAVCRIDDIVYKLVDKNINYENWLDLTASSGNDKSAVKYLSHCQDFEFKDLEPDRLARSFLNGIFIMRAGKEEFFSFNYNPEIRPSNLVCCKHYEQEFDTDIWETNYWFNIHTPAFEQILTSQKFKPVVQGLVYAMIGRLFYELNDLDNWQVIFFIKGVAQSGKSTIGNIAKRFFNIDDVAVLSSNIEEKFGLDSIADKMLYICFEVTKSWALPRSDFQSIISGEDVSLAKKHLTPRSVKWKTPGLLLGNEIGPWIDSSGSMVRRLLILEFKERISKIDPDLDKKLEEEFPRFIFKCQQAYVSYVEKYKGSGIWEKVPNYFKQVRDKIAINMNPIKEFINSEVVIRRPDLKMPYFVFDLKLTDYIKEKRWKVSRFSADEYESIFSDSHIKIVETSDEWEGNRLRGRWLIGIGLRDMMTDPLPHALPSDGIYDAVVHANEWHEAPVTDAHATSMAICQKFKVCTQNLYTTRKQHTIFVTANKTVDPEPMYDINRRPFQEPATRYTQPDKIAVNNIEENKHCKESAIGNIRGERVTKNTKKAKSSAVVSNVVNLEKTTGHGFRMSDVLTD